MTATPPSNPHYRAFEVFDATPQASVRRTVLDRIAERDMRTHEAIRTEIATKGTWWAASEIQHLREQIAALKITASPQKVSTDD